MISRGIPDVIGVTATGKSIIASTGCCTHFERQKISLACARECWYCKHADFRENTSMQKQYGICSRGRSMLSPNLSDDDLDAVVGGVAMESESIAYKCQCGAVFCCPIAECPICHSVEIQKIQ